jgi:hypothetical protein
MTRTTAGLIIAGGLLGALTVPTSGASAATVGGTRSHGLGFCVHAVAADPSLIGENSFGAAVSNVATSGPGALPPQLEELRYPVCGGPGAVE